MKLTLWPPLAVVVLAARHVSGTVTGPDPMCCQGLTPIHYVYFKIDANGAGPTFTTPNPNGQGFCSDELDDYIGLISPSLSGGTAAGVSWAPFLGSGDFPTGTDRDPSKFYARGDTNQFEVLLPEHCFLEEEAHFHKAGSGRNSDGCVQGTGEGNCLQSVTFQQVNNAISNVQGVVACYDPNQTCTPPDTPQFCELESEFGIQCTYGDYGKDCADGIHVRACDLTADPPDNGEAVSFTFESCVANIGGAMVTSMTNSALVNSESVQLDPVPLPYFDNNGLECVVFTVTENLCPGETIMVSVNWDAGDEFGNDCQNSNAKNFHANLKAPNGGDPHFTRWHHSRESFHGECDLVMVHAEDSEFDLHARTTIDSYFSYIDSAAFRVQDVTVEIQKDYFVVNGVKLSYKESLPLTQGPVTLVQTIDSDKKQAYEAHFLGSSIEFKFYKQFLSVNLSGGAAAMAGATGLLGNFPSGEMYNRDKQRTEEKISFKEHAFEWQVNPDDVKLFQEDRQPQLPFEACRMPTGARPARRHLRQNRDLLQQAEEACAKVSGSDFELCVDDVMMTGDIGLAEEAW